MQNALIEKMNQPEDLHLPRYLIIAIDDELIEDTNIFDYSAQEVLEDALKWLLINVNEAIEDRKTDLLKKKPGAVSSKAEPRLIWVTMLRRLLNTSRGHIYSLMRKFNSTLEDVISRDSKSHILKIHIEGNQQNYEESGKITPYGHIHFWRAIDAEMEEFDHGKTDLVPHKVNHENRHKSNKPVQARSNFNTAKFKWQKPRKQWHFNNRTTGLQL